LRVSKKKNQIEDWNVLPLQSEKYGSEESWKDILSFLIETMETAVKSWHETSSVDARVYFLPDKEKTQTDKYPPIVNIDKVCIFSTSFHCGSLGFFLVSFLHILRYLIYKL
jgi:hypothetical protein